MSARARQAALAVAAFGALGLAMTIQAARDRAYPRDDRQSTGVLYVRSGPALRRLTLEYQPVFADIYWIRAIQHYGGGRLTGAGGRSRYALLQPLLDITTSLDPYFRIAYRFGAIFLSEPFPGGPGRPDQAIALLRKGIGAQPGTWQYYHDIGFIYFWHLKDYQGAADWFARAADQPGAPNWLRPIVASMLTKTQDRSAAKFLWEQILKSDQEWLRRTAERNLVQLYTLDQMDQLDEIVRRFPPAAGQPYTWEDIVRRGGLRAIPFDPMKAPYVLDPATGAVTISPDSPLFPMPDAKRNPKS